MVSPLRQRAAFAALCLFRESVGKAWFPSALSSSGSLIGVVKETTGALSKVDQLRPVLGNLGQDVREVTTPVQLELRQDLPALFGTELERLLAQ